MCLGVSMGTNSHRNWDPTARPGTHEGQGELRSEALAVTLAPCLGLSVPQMGKAA